jgi:hypothetical protein
VPSCALNERAKDEIAAHARGRNNVVRSVGAFEMTTVGTLRTTAITPSVTGAEGAAIAYSNIGVSWTADVCDTFLLEHSHQKLKTAPL